MGWEGRMIFGQPGRTRSKDGGWTAAGWSAVVVLASCHAKLRLILARTAGINFFDGWALGRKAASIAARRGGKVFL